MVAGTVGAIVVARRARESGGFDPTPLSSAERSRQNAAWKEYKKRVAMNKLIKKYDANHTGKLERSQVIKLLTDADSSTPSGTPPTDEQVEFLLKVADKSGDNAIAAEELEELLTCWFTFVDHREEFEEKLKKYDKSNTGALNRDEVKEYLKDLNGGIEVTDKEVDMVMKEADLTGDGTVMQIELQRATAFWYGYVEEKKSCCSVL
mmetsp:Transcript_127768/g.355570  ORF Transcript_127768/g.355570 Transcript_127768/m.355570 type:complete len:206 (-) Transcript_127768:180-797(-)